MMFFFFSSRRRHTRWPRDWSSDVCSSDLGVEHGFQTGRRILGGLELGSPELWAMAERDLFCDACVYPTDPAKGPFVFILSGTSTYGHLKGLAAKGANEDGSDGTVRAS